MKLGTHVLNMWIEAGLNSSSPFSRCSSPWIPSQTSCYLEWMLQLQVIYSILATLPMWFLPASHPPKLIIALQCLRLPDSIFKMSETTWLRLHKAVPNYIFVSRKLDLEKPTRQSGKKTRPWKKRTGLYANEACLGLFFTKQYPDFRVLPGLLLFEGERKALR